MSVLSTSSKKACSTSKKKFKFAIFYFTSNHFLKFFTKLWKVPNIRIRVCNKLDIFLNIFHFLLVKLKEFFFYIKLIHQPKIWFKNFTVDNKKNIFFHHQFYRYFQKNLLKRQKTFSSYNCLFYKKNSVGNKNLEHWKYCQQQIEYFLQYFLLKEWLWFLRF